MLSHKSITLQLFYLWSLLIIIGVYFAMEAFLWLREWACITFQWDHLVYFSTQDQGHSCSYRSGFQKHVLDDLQAYDFHFHRYISHWFRSQLMLIYPSFDPHQLKCCLVWYRDGCSPFYEIPIYFVSILNLFEQHIIKCKIQL